MGFSETGVLKLFDFGFAISIDENKPNSLFEKCGTLRYMATEGKRQESIHSFVSFQTCNTETYHYPYSWPRIWIWVGGGRFFIRNDPLGSMCSQKAIL